MYLFKLVLKFSKDGAFITYAEDMLKDRVAKYCKKG